MKICLVNPTTLMRRPIADLAIFLSEKGHTVTVATPGLPDKKNKRTADKILDDHKQITVRRFPSREIKSILWTYPASFSFFNEYKNELNKNDVVQIWAPFYIFSFYPLWLKYWNKIFPPIILTLDTIPGYSFSMTPKPVDYLMKIFIKATRFFFNSATKITLYSDSLIPFANKIRLDNKKINVIPTGISISSSQEKPTLRSNNVLFIGILNNRKGVDTLIRTANQLKNNGINFTVVGSGPEEKKYLQMINEYKLTNVKFVGSVTNTSDYFNNASIFFLPSRGEGLAGVIMEAMNHGLPIVSSNIPCTGDLVKNGVNGFLCNQDDFMEFANVLLELTTNHQKRNEFGLQSKIIIKRFDWQKVLPVYEKLYASVVENK